MQGPHFCASSTEASEAFQQVVQERLAELLRVLKAVIAKHQALNSVDILGKAGTLIAKVKGKRWRTQHAADVTPGLEISQRAHLLSIRKLRSVTRCPSLHVYNARKETATVHCTSITLETWQRSKQIMTELQMMPRLFIQHQTDEY